MRSVPNFLPDARDVESNRILWKEVSRSEAFNHVLDTPVAVGFNTNGFFNVKWFDSSNQFYMANGPYNYHSLRYFLYLGGAAPKKVNSSAGSVAKLPKKEEAFDEPELVEKKEEVFSLYNAEWTTVPPSKGKEAEVTAISTALLISSICCKVSSEGLMPGDSVSFNILRSDNSEKIETIIGQVSTDAGNDFAFAKWHVRGKIVENALRKGPLDVYFVAKNMGRKLEAKSPKLTICDSITIHHHLDVDEENAKNDIFILETTDGSWTHTLEVSKMKEVKPDWVEMVFPGAPQGKKFNLVKDPKDGEEPFYIFKDLDYDLLTKDDHFAEV